MKKLFLLLLLAFVSITLFAQRYEGERNKKGEPDGQGIMYFDDVKNGLYTEKLEGKFKDGYPVSGKSYRYDKVSGRIIMRFSGKFKLEKEGVFNSLFDLHATGDIVCFFYENDKSYNDYGFQAAWGKYDGNGIQSGHWLSCKRKQMGPIIEGKWKKLDRNATLTSEAKKHIKEATQHYEGETNAKGEPNGYGTLYFYEVDGTYNEKLEGTFQDGVPVRGRSFRYFKSDGRPKMRFSGTFQLKKKGVLNKLSDLLATGNIVFFYYEDSKSYNDNGIQVAWGENEGNDLSNGFWLSCKKKQVGRITNGKWGKLDSSGFLTAEAQKYYNEIVPPAGSAWLLFRKPVYGDLSDTVDEFFKCDEVHWKGAINNGLIDGKGEGTATVKLGKATVDYKIAGTFRDGVPVSVTIDRTYSDNSHFDKRYNESSILLTMGNLRNNLREFNIESLSSKYLRFDFSYSGYVDENFQFKEDYTAEMKEAKKDREYQAMMGFGKVMQGAIAVSTLLSDSGSGGGTYKESSSSKSDTGSSDESIDVEKIGMPKYVWEGDWYVDAIVTTEKTTGEGGENQTRKIKYADGTKGKIVRVVGYKGYWSTKKRYKTIEDAITAEYAYQKYNKIRLTGGY